MSIDAAILERLAALDLPAEKLNAVLVILADSHKRRESGRSEANRRAYQKRKLLNQHTEKTDSATENLLKNAEKPLACMPACAPAFTVGDISNNIPQEPMALTPKIKTARRKARRPIAPDEQPSDQDCAVAAHLPRENFRREWQQFRDHHIAKGSLMADWQAAWRTWVGNIGKFSRGPPAREHKPSLAERMEAFVNRGSENDQNHSGRPPIIDGNVLVLSERRWRFGRDSR